MKLLGKMQSLALLVPVLMALSGCSTHCSCPAPQQQPAPTTIIHEEPHDY